ncbi:MAG: hypothetical protein IT429_17980 [Gemmataceae bacterium]|nr:hypothetical protein [Gemmataceae bacterium]
MTPEQAVQRLNVLFAHLWLVRTFLKHADEVQEDEAMLDVHRTIFDYVRATEPAYQRGDWAEYLRRARGKLSKLKRVAEFFEREYRRVSDHTNFQMAALSLSGCARQVEEVLAEVSLALKAPPAPTPDHGTES